MSIFHETIREYLEDVHAFLVSSLRSEVLSQSALLHREQLLAKLQHLQKEYPQLQLDNINESLRFKANLKSGNGVINSNEVDVGKYSSLQLEPEDSINDYEYVGDKFLGPTISAVELLSPDKCGYLEKKGKERFVGFLSPFQRRWCVIKNGALYYYERPTDQRQRGMIYLAGYEANPNPSAIKDTKREHLCFELTCPGKRSYQFISSTTKDMWEWIAAIERNNKPLLTGLENTQDVSDIGVENDRGDTYEVVNECITSLGSLMHEKVSENLNNKMKDKNELQDLNFKDFYVGLWDCCAEDEHDLSFMRGDLIHIISKEYDSYAWWVGQINNKVGLVPKAYLMEAFEAI